MSGGAALGSYEAGALWGIIKNTNETARSKFAWDVVTGVSAGSINAMAVSLFKPGTEDDMAEWLSNTWSTLTTAKVYKDWSPLGIITGLLSKSGIFDDGPLYKLLQGFYQEKGGLKRKTVVSCVDANSGQYITFNETISDMPKASLSSSSMPFVFPHQVWEDINGEKVVCMDGGSVWNTNLVSAVQRCREQVDDDSEITLDVIDCGSPDAVGSWKDQNNAISNYMRFRDIQSYTSGSNDLNEFLEAFPKVNLRYYITPSAALPGGLSLLNFDNETVTWPSQM
jgi:predicted acylesterase/phospholipase RssA